MKILEGWVYEVQFLKGDTVVWIVDTKKCIHRLLDHFAPTFYVGGDPKEWQAVAHFLIDRPWDVTLSRAQMPDSRLDFPARVLKVGVEDPQLLKAIINRIMRFKPEVIGDCRDTPITDMYLQMRQIRPLALCRFALDKENRILGIESDEKLFQEW
ncbi:MAG: hypothetical protein M1132_13625 [Chloroflexi bacterium]|nr:hypothetical protein [Chloroflexota bacterium]